MRYFLELAYLGAPFHGWQRQPNAPSVQQALEEALATVLRLPEPVPVTGAGRTDAGVNASMMVAHVDLDCIPMGEQALLHSLNSILGQSIAIYGIREVAPDAHARFDAVKRTYHYYANTRKSPFTGGLSWQAPRGFDFEAMNRAAELLLHTADFTSFAKLHTDTKTNICHVTQARWLPLSTVMGADAPLPAMLPSGADWVFVISADRFLRNMVRAVVGTLAEVGRGKLTIDGFRRIIEQRDRCAAGTSMPPGPLFLHHIEYPY